MAGPFDPRTIARQRRLAQLRARDAAGTITMAEADELDALVANETQFIKRLPRSLAAARARVAGLEAIAREIGIRHP